MRNNNKNNISGLNLLRFRGANIQQHTQDHYSDYLRDFLSSVLGKQQQQQKQKNT